MTTLSQKYPYAHEYQMDVLRLCVQDPSFLPTYEVDVIQARYFTLDSFNVVYKLIQQFFTSYHEIPSYAHLTQAASDYFVQYNMRVERQGTITDVVDRVYTEPLVNRQAVLDTICDFAQRQALIRSAKEIGDIAINGGDPDKAVEVIRKAATIGSRKRKSWSLFGKAGELTKILQTDASYNPKFKIPTGFPTVDKNTFGGIGVGQIFVVAAPPKTGKSTLMASVGVAAMAAGHNVFHYSFGDMNEVDVLMKYIMRLSNLTTEQIMLGHNYMSRVSRFKSNCRGADVVIRYDSPGKVGVNELYNSVGHEIAKSGRQPGLIIVDYANKMKFPILENSYRSMSMIYEGLKELGDAYECGVLTGVQIRRGSSDTPGPGDVADSYMQVADADAMFFIYRDGEENNPYVQNSAADREDELNPNRQRRLFLSMPIVRRGFEIPRLPVTFRPAIAQMREERLCQ